MGEAFITRRGGSSGVKMACGFDGGPGGNTWEETGLGFKPSDIRIQTYQRFEANSVSAIVWQESKGGACILFDESGLDNQISEVKVTTTNDGFVIGPPDDYANYGFSNNYFWYAFEEEQEMWG